MKIITALSVAMLSIAPVAAFAQDVNKSGTSTTEGMGEKQSRGEALPKTDAGSIGRSSSEDSAATGRQKKMPESGEMGTGETNH